MSPPIRPTIPPLDFGEELARQLVARMRSRIDRHYASPEARDSAWTSFLAMAGHWATAEGLRQPGAYQALAPIVERLSDLLPKRNMTLSGIAAVPKRGAG